MPRGRVTVGERIGRARRIGTTFGRVYLGIKTNQFIEKRLDPPDMSQRWSRFNLESAESIYSAAIDLRGLILKGCQFLGARADVLPPEYIEVLAKLQDRVPARSFATVQRIVERELRRPMEEVFQSFSQRPIAAASLAQVHEAQLLDGTQVAVKVQYPEIAGLVRSDLANLRMLFRAVGAIERDFDLMPLVDELGAYVPKELDFVNEGRTSETVAAFYTERDDVVIPKVFWEFSTRRVLVMEFMDGIKISDTEALAKAGVDCTDVMQTVIEAYCEQILVHGLFHADPHPGNLMVQPGAASGGRPRIVFLDFGLAKDLPSDFRDQIVSFAGAMLTGNADAMAQSLIDLGFETRDGSTDSLHEISRIVLETATRLRNQSFVERDFTREAGEEIPRLVRENPIVRIPSHLVLLGRVVGLLSGLGRTLDARVDMVKTIMPYALRAKDSPTGSA